MDPLISKVTKFYTLRFYQLKVRNKTIGTVSNRIKVAKNTEYCYYGDIKQYVIYFYTKCQKWQAKR